MRLGLPLPRLRAKLLHEQQSAAMLLLPAEWCVVHVPNILCCRRIEALRDTMADLLSIPCQVLHKRDSALELMQTGGHAAGLDRAQRISA